MRESALKRFAIQYLRSMGWYVVKIAPPVESGTPDLIGCYRGAFVGIELKVGRSRPTKLQEYRLRQIRTAGGLSFIARTRDEVRAIALEVEDAVAEHCRVS